MQAYLNRSGSEWLYMLWVRNLHKYRCYHRRSRRLRGIGWLGLLEDDPGQKTSRSIKSSGRHVAYESGPRSTSYGLQMRWRDERERKGSCSIRVLGTD